LSDYLKSEKKRENPLLPGVDQKYNKLRKQKNKQRDSKNIKDKAPKQPGPLTYNKTWKKASGSVGLVPKGRTKQQEIQMLQVGRRGQSEKNSSAFPYHRWIFFESEFDMTEHVHSAGFKAKEVQSEDGGMQILRPRGPFPVGTIVKIISVLTKFIYSQKYSGRYPVI